MARLTFMGATGGVTGSLYLLETEQSKILLECGLIQGSREEEKKNSEPFLFDPKSIDAVVLSHAHLDHSGRLPLLVKCGYRGPVYVTWATGDLLDIMLHDAASLNMRDAEWENKRRRRSGKEEVEPLYNDDDVRQTIKLFDRKKYGESFDVAQDINITYHDAGHILGSSIVEVTLSDTNPLRKLVFSGDLGNSCTALLRDPVRLSEANAVIMESTYGNRDHRSHDATLQEFEDILKEAAETGGNILIPSFAVGRTQELIFRLGEFYHKGSLSSQMVYLDSPMAIAATEVYHRYQNIFNTDDKNSILKSEAGTLHQFLPILRYSRTTEESVALNNITHGAIIIAGSGMCNGGRIRHHLKHNLWRRGSHVIIVGFQARNTPGLALVDGASSLRLLGQDIVVNAKIHTLGGFSAHAGQQQLIDWVNGFNQARPKVYLVHGEDEAKATLRDKVEGAGFNVTIPYENQVIDI